MSDDAAVPLHQPDPGHPQHDNQHDNQAGKQAEKPGGKKGLSKSATRALDVLEYFAMMGRPLKAVEIAQAFGLHASSADQLLKTMVDSAYLVFDSHRKLYYPSPRLVNFGSWISANYFGEDRICRLLREVHDRTGVIVTLSIRYGTQMQLVDLIEPPVQAGTLVKGSRVPIMDSIIGITFLASHDEREVIALIEQISQETGKRISLTALRELIARVNAVRAAGYLSGPAVAADGPYAMAVVLPRPASGMAMVLGLAGERTEFIDNEARLVDAARSAVARWLG